MAPKPRSSAGCATSIMTTSTPAVAHAWAMPLPIVPAPITPTCSIVCIRYPLPNSKRELCLGDRCAFADSRGLLAGALARGKTRRRRSHAVDEHVDQHAGGGREVMRRGIEHPVLHDAADVRVQCKCGERRVGVAGQLTRRNCLLQHALDVHQAMPALALLPLRQRGHIAVEISFVLHDLEHRLRARIVGEPRQHGDGQHTERAERIIVRDSAGVAQHRLHRQQRPLAHRSAEVRLVAEMPVHRAARHARGRGDFGERAPRNAAPAENILRCVEQLLARDCRLFLRPACHAVRIPYLGPAYETLYKQSRLYVRFRPRTRRTATVRAVFRNPGSRLMSVAPHLFDPPMLAAHAASLPRRGQSSHAGAALRRVLPLVLIAALAACGQKPQGGGFHGFPPAEVTVQPVALQTFPVTFEYVGQTQGSKDVEVRARVTGIIEKRLFEEGSPVKAGQTLFIIDARQYQAQVAAANADVARAQAQKAQADRESARLKPLAERKAIGQKEADDAASAADLAAAAVKASQAKVSELSVNLGYTKVIAPISGLTSRAQKSEGSLATANETLLTTISQTNPIWVIFNISENEQLRLNRAVAANQLQLPKDNAYDVTIKLADGSTLPRTGRINFADTRINPTTGTYEMRAEVANPDGALKPGQFVRVVLKGAARQNVVAVPQVAVLDGPQGKFVYTLGKDKDGKDVAVPRPVVVGDWVDANATNQWVIESGLKPGDQVLINGIAKLMPGGPVKIGSAPAAGAPGAGAPGAPAAGGPAAPSASTAASNPASSPASAAPANADPKAASGPVTSKAAEPNDKAPAKATEAAPPNKS